MGSVRTIRSWHSTNMLCLIPVQINDTALDCQIPNCGKYTRDVERIYIEEDTLAD